MRVLSARRDGWSTAAAGAGPVDVDVAGWLATGLGTAAGGSAVAAGSLLVLRRMAGSLGDAVPAAGLLGVAAIAAALVALADVAWRLGGPWAAVIAVRIGTILAMAGVAASAWPATWPDRVAGGLAVAIAAAAVLLVPRRDVAPRAGSPPSPRRGDAAGRRRPRRTADRAPGQLRQRFARYETPAGAECVRGRIAVLIASGARSGHGHVGFCPAFERSPTVAVSTDYDGVEATVAAAEILPWGVRVEVRLTEPAEEAIVIPVDLVASTRS